GLVLMVNGFSTLYEEPQQSDAAKNLAWVLEPGRQYVIRGYQQDNQNVKPFHVLSSADSEAVSYTENTGLIHFHIVKPGGSDGSKQIAGGDESSKGGNGSPAMNISLRGLKGSNLFKHGRTRSLADLKRSAHTRKSRGLIERDGAIEEQRIQNDE